MEKYGHFIVFDDNGEELLSDSGDVGYGFDGKSTYVVSGVQWYTNMSLRSWRFRTDITLPTQQLAKRTFQPTFPVMQTYGCNNGSYRINLQPGAGGETTVELFDLGGRLLFTRLVDCRTKPVSLTIPEGHVPNSPFIAKARNGSGECVKREIPVK